MTGLAMNEDFTTMDEGEEAPTVQLADGAGRSLLCYVERSMAVDSNEYLLLTPVDAPIEIFAWEVDEEDDEDETLVDIEDDELDEVFDTAKAVLAEQDLMLHRTALTLTASGNLPDAQEEDIITLDISEGGEEDDLTSEQFQLLTNFYYEEQEYAICTPFEPLLFFARMSAAGQPELLSPDEFRIVRSQLEDQLFDDLE